MGKVSRQKLRRRHASTTAATTSDQVGRPVSSDGTSSATAVSSSKRSSKKKSVKMRDKHEKFMHKIQMSSTSTQLPSSSRRSRRRRGGVKNLIKKSILKKRPRGGIVGGIRTLLDALPDLDPVPSASITSGSRAGVGSRSSSSSRRDRRSEAAKGFTKRMPKKRPLSKFKTSQKNMMKDIAVFRQVLKQPGYLADPTGTISSHLRKTIGIID